uniref:L1 transposable element RRM domain-containing protein n=1 Tax=Equus caballus TaxID=9796 RepID=A0A9L0TJ28_HORSE
MQIDNSASSRSMSQEIETIKKNQSEMLDLENTMVEIKQNMDTLNSKADIMEERISNIEDKNKEMLQLEEERELRLKRSEESLQETSDQIKKCSIRITGIQEGEEKENGAESLFREIIAENFPNLRKEMEIHVTEASISPNSVNVKRPTARYIVVKLKKVNDKEKILRAAREKKITYKLTSIRLLVDFSAETLHSRRD